jgi:hypothetical protein
LLVLLALLCFACFLLCFLNRFLLGFRFELLACFSLGFYLLDFALLFALLCFALLA